MASAMGSPSRIFFIVSLAMLSLFWPDALRAEKAAALPDYVIKEFGKLPAVPEGPLSADLQSAVQMAFINCMQKRGIIYESANSRFTSTSKYHNII